MSRFTILDTPIIDLKIVERQQLGDSRGFFSRLFCTDELAAAGWLKPIAQINQTFTQKQGTIRGMHFQHPPYAENKLVNCLSGAVFDVAVDLRADSPTFLRWHGEILSAENRRSLLIPEGFAHGFQTLTEDCELIYLHTAPYHPEAEGAINVADPALTIIWPLAVSEQSERDQSLPLIGPHFSGICL
jgi:dTDP-4-dehydrorhamnose 3,5-epimerase